MYDTTIVVGSTCINVYSSISHIVLMMSTVLSFIFFILFLFFIDGMRHDRPPVFTTQSILCHTCLRSLTAHTCMVFIVLCADEKIWIINRDETRKPASPTHQPESPFKPYNFFRSLLCRRNIPCLYDKIEPCILHTRIGTASRSVKMTFSDY